MRHPNTKQASFFAQQYGVIDIHFLLRELKAQRWLILRSAVILGLVALAIALKPTPPKVHATLRVDPGGGKLSFALSSMQNVDTEIGTIKSWSAVKQALLDADYTASVSSISVGQELLATSSESGGEAFAVEFSHLYFPDILDGKKLILEFKKANQFELQTSTGRSIATGRIGQLLTGSASSLNGNRAQEPYRLQIDAIHAAEGARFLIEPQRLDKLTESILSDLSVTKRNSSPGANLIDVELSASDPQLAFHVVDALVQGYIKQSQQRQSSAQLNAVSQLKESLGRLEKQVETRKQALLDFLDETNILDPETTAKNLLQQKFSLLSQRHATTTKLAQQSLIFTDNHPAIIALQKEEAIIQEALSALAEEINTLPKQQSRLQQLQRDLQLSTELYQNGIREFARVQLEANSIPQTTQIIDQARIIKPKRLRYIIQLAVFGGLFGTIISLSFILLKASMKFGMVISPKQLSQMTDLPVMQAIIAVTKKGLRPTSKHQLSNQLHYSFRRHPPKWIGISGPRRDAQTAKTVCEIASILAQHKRVLLLDAHFYQSPLSPLLGHQTSQGLSDVLTQHVKAIDVITPVQSADYTFLACGTEMLNYDLLRDPKSLTQLLDSLSDQYDHMLVFLPDPLLLPQADALFSVFHHMLHLVRCGMHIEKLVPYLEECDKHASIAQNIVLYELESRRGLLSSRGHRKAPPTKTPPSYQQKARRNKLAI